MPWLTSHPASSLPTCPLTLQPYSAMPHSHFTLTSCHASTFPHYNSLHGTRPVLAVGIFNSSLPPPISVLPCIDLPSPPLEGLGISPWPVSHCPSFRCFSPHGLLQPVLNNSCSKANSGTCSIPPSFPSNTSDPTPTHPQGQPCFIFLRKHSDL